MTSGSKTSDAESFMPLPQRQRTRLDDTIALENTLSTVFLTEDLEQVSFFPTEQELEQMKAAAAAAGTDALPQNLPLPADLLTLPHLKQAAGFCQSRCPLPCRPLAGWSVTAAMPLTRMGPQ